MFAVAVKNKGHGELTGKAHGMMGKLVWSGAQRSNARRERNGHCEKMNDLWQICVLCDFFFIYGVCSKKGAQRPHITGTSESYSGQNVAVESASTRARSARRAPVVRRREADWAELAWRHVETLTVKRFFASNAPRNVSWTWHWCAEDLLRSYKETGLFCLGFAPMTGLRHSVLRRKSAHQRRTAHPREKWPNAAFCVSVSAVPCCWNKRPNNELRWWRQKPSTSGGLTRRLTLTWTGQCLSTTLLPALSKITFSSPEFFFLLEKRCKNCSLSLASCWRCWKISLIFNTCLRDMLRPNFTSVEPIFDKWGSLPFA